VTDLEAERLIFEIANFLLRNGGLFWSLFSVVKEPNSSPFASEHDSS
jgi:hypothetical protein